MSSPKHVDEDGGLMNNVEVGSNETLKLTARSRSEHDLRVPKLSTSSSTSADNVAIKISQTAPASRAGSWASRFITMEEVAPLRTKLFGDIQEEQSEWKQPLTEFTSKRRGSQKEDKNLPKCIRRYYKQQDQLISAYEGIQIEDTSDIGKKIRKRASILAKASFFINLILLCGKLVAAIMSGSLSVITSVVDSAVDLVSGTLMWWSSRAMKQRDIYLYPQGRTKLEPVAIVILSVVMALASVQMIRQAVEKIVAYALYDVQNPEQHNESAVFCLTIPEMYHYTHTDGRDGPHFEIESIVICVATICIKLALFIICRRNPNPSSQALAQDHRNDVVSNTGALACGLIGYRLWKYADPIGAVLISIYIIVSWCTMGWAQIKMLTGHTARPEFLKKLTWIAINHHEKVMYIDTVRAFHFGSNFLVEVDIVLPEDMSLMESHDIGEALQKKLEKLEEVERAFVHLDYEVEHNPNLEHKIV